MAPTRPRAIDDSRSETSSTITNLKDKAALGPVTGGAAVSKNKRNMTGQNSSSKATTNGTGAGSSAAEHHPKVRPSSGARKVSNQQRTLSLIAPIARGPDRPV